MLGSAARPAQAWCGKPYPRWAYGLRFNDGLIQIPLPGLAKPADVFLRVVGDENKEKQKHVAPLIVFPGGPGLAHDYTETLEALVYADRRVIAFDPVGTGQSSPILPPSLLPSSGTTEEEREQIWSELIQIQVKEIIRFLEIEGEHHVWAHGAGCLPAIQYTSSLPPSSSSSLFVKSLTLASPFVFSPGKTSLPSWYSANDAAVPLCVTESVAGGGGKEGAKEQRVFYNKRLEGLPALAELGGGGGVPVFVSYSAGEDGALGLDEAAVGRLRKRIEEGGKEGRRARVVVKAFEGRVPHIDQPEQYVDWLDEMMQIVEKPSTPAA
ncbi:prolyl aminopeptidase [Nannochloropsis oceanica]